MPLKSYQIPPVKDRAGLEKFLRDFNAAISKCYILSVELGTEGEDKGKNLIIVDANKTETQVPMLRDFSNTLSEVELAGMIAAIEDSEKLVARNYGNALLGTDTRWVVLFDPVPIAGGPAPGTGNTPPIAAPPNHGSIGTITSDHWLGSAQRAQIGEGSELAPLFVVIHYTEGWSAESSIHDWRTKNDGILAHVVVDRDGKIFQCRPFNQSCRHAGPSRLRHPKTGKLYEGLNSFSIGIEIANTGQGGDSNLHASLKRHFPQGRLITAAHRNAGIPGADPHAKDMQWEAYPETQLASVFGLVSILMAKYKLADITGHDCIAFERKTDPGPAFPMRALREANGLSGLPNVWDKKGDKFDL